MNRQQEVKENHGQGR